MRRDSIVDEDEEDNQKQLSKDKIWLEAFINEKLKKAITKIEHEVDNIRNKKVRGAVKKQKDMLKQLNDKLKLMRNTRIKCEELAMTIGFLEGGDIRSLKVLLKKYYEDPDQDEARESVDKEVDELIQRADQNRQSEQIMDKIKTKEEEEKRPSNQDSKFGYLSWLHDIIDLSQFKEVCLVKQISSINDLKEGMILDAQDYLDKWHLSVVCKVQPDNDSEAVKINFLPYPKGNRDEWISKTELTNRLGGPFSQIPQETDKEKLTKNFCNLQEYARKFIKPDDRPHASENRA